MSSQPSLSVFPDSLRFGCDLAARFSKGSSAVASELGSLPWYWALAPVACAQRLSGKWVEAFVDIPAEATRNSSAPWLSRFVDVTGFSKHADAHGKQGAWWIPKTTLEWTARAGLMAPSLSCGEMLRMMMIFIPQMSIACTWRCIQYRFNFGRWKPSPGNNHNTYLAIINTSLATYYNHQENAFVFYDVALHSDHMRGRTTFQKIAIRCDLIGQTVECIELFPVDSSNVESIIIVNCDEISVVTMQIAALVSHPQVHWWANGVKEVSQWKLANASSRWVQFLNHCAIFQSLFFYHSEFDNNTAILGQNTLGGMPMHGHIPKEISELSVTHRMASAARVRIEKHFQDAGTPIGHMELSCLLCATLYHSADHYYASKYLGVGGISETLTADFRTMRLCLVGAYRWVGTKFMCQQYPEDPVCAILCDIALQYDPEFHADGILSIGPAI